MTNIDKVLDHLADYDLSGSRGGAG
jgi:hypothetical protein